MIEMKEREIEGGALGNLLKHTCQDVWGSESRENSPRTPLSLSLSLLIFYTSAKSLINNNV